MLTATATKVDLSSVERGLDALYARGRDVRPALAGLRKPARRDQVEHGRAQSGPDGRWVRRDRSKKSRRRRRLLGRLPSATFTRVTRASLVVQSRAKWSQIHQQGGRAGNGARIPARRFLWWSDAILEEAQKQIVAALERAW